MKEKKRTLRIGKKYYDNKRRLTLGAETACPSRCAFALPVIGAAVSPVVTVTSLNTIRSKLAWWTSWKIQLHDLAWSSNTPTIQIDSAYSIQLWMRKAA